MQSGGTSLESAPKTGGPRFRENLCLRWRPLRLIWRKIFIGRQSLRSPQGNREPICLQNLRCMPRLVQPLRYGENPHQKAALYGDFSKYFQQLHGKELSYNNILDLTAAAALIGEFGTEKPSRPF